MRMRLTITAALLGLVLWGVASVHRAYGRRVAELRSQPLVTLIEQGSRTPRPGPLATSATVVALDAALVPKVKATLQRGVPASSWGNTDARYSDQSRFTPLMVAAMLRMPKTAQVLIDAGADPDVVDQDGRTALIWAVKNGNSEVIRVLLAAGADPDIVDRRRRTAIDYADAYSMGWDNQGALLRPLKRAHAKRGPYALAKRDPYERFIPKRSKNSRFSYQCSGDGITFRANCTLEFQPGAPPIVTREKYRQLRKGMTYPEIAAILGEAEVSGEMLPEYEGSFTYRQEKRQIVLWFRHSRLTGKSASGLGWWLW